MHDISWFFGKTLAQKIGFLNLKKNLVINFHRILFKSKNLYYLLCVYTNLVFGKNLAPEIFTKMLSSDCRVLKLFISLEQIDETASFLACWNKFAKIWTWLKVFWLGQKWMWPVCSQDYNIGSISKMNRWNKLIFLQAGTNSGKLKVDSIILGWVWWKITLAF